MHRLGGPAVEGRMPWPHLASQSPIGWTPRPADRG